MTTTSQPPASSALSAASAPFARRTPASLGERLQTTPARSRAPRPGSRRAGTAPATGADQAQGLGAGPGEELRRDAARRAGSHLAEPIRLDQRLRAVLELEQADDEGPALHERVALEPGDA